MASRLIRRDQFEITPEGITHLPTGARFTPHPERLHPDPARPGRSWKHRANEQDYDRDEVHRIMRELWAEYLARSWPK
jgi:hypothetical protein